LTTYVTYTRSTQTRNSDISEDRFRVIV